MKNPPVRAKYEERIATYSPSKLFFEPMFWRDSIGPLMVVVLFVAITFSLRYFIFDVRQGLGFLFSLSALGLSFFALPQIFRELARLEVEDALIKATDKRGQAYLDKNTRAELDDLADEISLINNSRPAPATLRILQQVVNQAKIRKFDSNVNLMDTGREQATDVIFRLLQYQKIALWIGIAGTFVGIILAIQPDEINRFLSDPPAQLANFTNSMFGGLSISFSASLAGLVTAVFLGFMIVSLRNRHEAYFQRLERTVTIMIRAARQSHNKDVPSNELDILDDKVNENRRYLEQLYHSVRELQNLVLSQNASINETVRLFVESNRRIAGLLDMTEQELRSNRDALGLRDAFTATIEAAGEVFSASVSKEVAEVKEVLVSFREASARYSAAVNQHSQQTDGLIMRLTSSIIDLTGRLSKIRFPKSPFTEFLDRLLGRS